jgi:hypothetical protein
MDNPNVIYASGSGDANNPAPLVWSIDGGLTWTNMPVSVNNLTNSTVTLGSYRIAMEVPIFDGTNTDYADKMYAIVIKDPDLETGILNSINTALGNTIKNFQDPNPSCDDRLTAKLYRFNFNHVNTNNSYWTDKGWLFSGVFYSQNGNPCASYTADFNPMQSYQSGGIDMSRAQSFGISPVESNVLFFGDVRMAKCTTGLDDNFGAYFTYNGAGQNNDNIHDDIHSIKPFLNGSGLIQVGDGGASTTTAISLGNGFARKNKGLNIANVLRFSTYPKNKNIYVLGLMHDFSAVAKDNEWFEIGAGDGQTPMVNYINGYKMHVSYQGGGFMHYSWNGTSFQFQFSFKELQDWNSFAILNSQDPAVIFLPSQRDPNDETNPTPKGTDDVKRRSDYGVVNDGYISNINAINGIPQGAIIWKMYTSKANANYLLIHIVYKINAGTPQEQTINRLFYNTNVNNSNLNLIKNSWTEINLPFNDVAWVDDIYIDDQDVNKFYAVLGNNFTHSQLWNYNSNTGWSSVSNDFNSNFIKITSVVKQPGTQRFYVGTSNRGVLTADFSPLSNEYSIWKQFNNNLPYANVTDIEIMECDGLLRVGTFGRGIWEADLVPGNSNKFVISSDLTISTDIAYNQGIVVTNNAKLTINAEVSLNKFNSIIVERGSQLIVDGPNAKIRNACQSRWSGIQVWGNSNVPQNYSNSAEFGKVIIRNGGTIENAETGITTMKIDDQGNWDWNYSGGIVQCTDANFVNNGHDVVFLGYANHNVNGNEMITQSYFTRTKFLTKTNFNYKEFGAPNWHVTIDNSSGIRFKGCTFKNLRTTAPTEYTGPANKWGGGGILAINSQVFVDQYCAVLSVNCANGTPTIFENLYQGITAKGTLTNRKLNCYHSKFLNNAFTGISVQSQNNCNILFNDFSYDGNNLYQYLAQSGMYQIGALISNTTGYRIEENNFTGDANGSLSQAGIKIVNSGGSPNQIYRNNFSNLYYGATALGTNRNTNIAANGAGLQILCVTHQNNTWDNAVTKKYNEPGIALYQGNLLGPNFKAADNSFSTIAGTVCIDVFNYYNECNFINYAGTNNLQFSPALYDCNSIYVGNNVATNTGCPSKSNLHRKLAPAEKQTVSGDFSAKKIELEETKLLLNLVTDGGNTNTVINAIAQSQPAQTQQLVSSLMSLSPNVSLPVLLKVAHEDEKMSPTLQMLILIANTQGGKNQKIIDTLRNKQNPMDPAMIDYILDHRNNTSLKEKIESKVATLTSEKDYLALVLINDLIEDTTGVDEDSILTLTKEMDTDEKYYMPLYMAIADNNFSLCDSLYTSMEDSLLEKYQRTDYLSMAIIIELEKTLKSSNRNYHQLDSNEIASLRVLTQEEYHSKGVVIAQNILENAKGDKFEPYLKFPEIMEERRSKPLRKNIFSSDTFESLSFSLYPNPTKNQTNLSYILLNGQKGVVTIADNNGKLVYENVLSNDQNSLSIDLSNLATGAYYLNVMIDKVVKYKETIVLER